MVEVSLEVPIDVLHDVGGFLKGNILRMGLAECGLSKIHWH